MSSDRELTRVVQLWLQDREDVLPERVLDDVLDLVHTTPQDLPFWRAWRKELRGNTFKLAAAAVAVLAAAGIGFALYFSRPAISPASSPSPQPTHAAPTVSATPDTSDRPSTAPAVGSAPWVVFLYSTDINGAFSGGVWAMRSDGSDPVEVLHTTEVPNFAWFQDGRRLLVATTDGTVSIADVAEDIGPLVDTGFRTNPDTVCTEIAVQAISCQDSAFDVDPDGNRAVFVRTCVAAACHFLSLLNLETGELTAIDSTLDPDNEVALPDWSPDGTQIAYTSAPPGVTLASRGGDDISNLFIVDSDGVNKRQIDLSGSGETGDWVVSAEGPSWSLDGSTIAFMGTKVFAGGADPEGGIFSVAPDGSDLTELTLDGAWPEWNLSNQIRYRRDPAEFWLVNADGSGTHLDADLNPGLDAISPSGSYDDVGVPGDPGREFLWQPTRSAEPDAQATPTGSPTSALPTSAASPSDEPAGLAPWVAFLDRPCTEQCSGAYALRADGSSLNMLDNPGDRWFGNSVFAWSKDGQRLLMAQPDGTIYEAVGDELVLSPDEVATTQRETACLDKSATSCQDSAFDYAPDGDQVVFVRTCSGPQGPQCSFLSTLDLRTGELTELGSTVTTTQQVALPDWSPDGAHIAFTQGSTDQDLVSSGGTAISSLYVVDSDGSNLHQIELNGQSETDGTWVVSAEAPDWSPDGSSVVFAGQQVFDSGAEMISGIFRVDADGSNYQALATIGGGAPEWTLSNHIRYAWFPDGYRLMNADGTDDRLLVNPDLVLARRYSPVRASMIGFPGEPAHLYHWQPTASDELSLSSAFR